jgi:hypothetical protein
MNLHEEEAAKAFEDLLAVPGSQENAIQNFLETHTAFMLTPGLLNHQLHLSCVISKFPIGGRIADYAYLTKSSDEWKLVLVELEDSHKKLFRMSSGHVGFSSPMNDAIAQIDVWRDHWKDNKKAVVETLEPLLVPPAMRRNSVSLECVLIIGRSSEKDHHEERRKRLAALRADKGINVMTFDTLLRSYRAGHEHPKGVLTKTNKGYRLRSVEGLPSTTFSYIRPEHLSLDPKAEKVLRKAGYDIDAWLRNEPLMINDKWPLGITSEEALARGADPAVAKFIARSAPKPRS